MFRPPPLEHRVAVGEDEVGRYQELAYWSARLNPPRMQWRLPALRIHGFSLSVFFLLLFYLPLSPLPLPLHTFA